MKKFHYEYIQKDNGLNGPLIVFFHGFMGSTKDWYPLIKDIPYSCLLIDLPGHGNTLLERFITTEEFLSSVESFLARYQQEKYLVGYSMGGRIAMGLLKKRLNFKHVFLESCHPGLEDIKEKELRYFEDSKIFDKVKSKKDLELFLEQWYQNPIFSFDKDNTDYAGLLKGKLNYEWHKWQKALNIMSVGIQDNYWPILEEENTPITFIYGEQDSKYSLIADRIGKSNDSIKSICIASCGHNTHFQNKDKFQNILLKQLSLYHA